MKKYNCLNKLKNCNSVALISHVYPDADAFGCMVAMRDFLQHKLKVKQVDIFVDCENIPQTFKDMLKNVQINPNQSQYNAVIMMDCPNLVRLGKYQEIFNKSPLTFVIDHHSTNEKCAQYNIVEIISSSCELVYKIAQEYNYNFDTEILSYMYAGIVTDTGGFAWGAITKDTFKIASACVDNVDIFSVYSNYLNCYSLLNMQLYAQAINNLTSKHNNDIIFTYITEEELKRFKAKLPDLFMIPNTLNKIHSAKFSIFVEPHPDGINVSLRCKKGYDVGTIAKEFGGGGHMCASGFVTNKSVNQVKTILFKNFTQQLDNHQ